MMKNSSKRKKSPNIGQASAKSGSSSPEVLSKKQKQLDKVGCKLQSILASISGDADVADTTRFDSFDKVMQIADKIEQKALDPSSKTVQDDIARYESETASTSKSHPKPTNPIIYTPSNIPCEKNQYNRFFRVSFGDLKRRTVNPYSVLNCIAEKTGQKPLFLHGDGKFLTLKVKNKEQADKVIQISKINEVNCTITPHPVFNTSKGLIFLQEFDVDNLEDFEAEMKDNYNVSKVEKADFIKCRNPETKAYIVEFTQEYTPYSIYIPGERADTRVQPYKRRPMLCKQCLDYGHTAKHCHNDPRCKTCSTVGHTRDQCTADRPYCRHCQGEHATGSRDCDRYKKEQTILDIQEQEKIPALRARQMLHNNTVAYQKTKQIFSQRISTLRCCRTKNVNFPLFFLKSAYNII